MHAIDTGLTAKGVTQDLDALHRITAKYIPESVAEKPVSQWPVG